ncbi:hypothetical protein R6Q57_008381 [Mikania cordata]
MERFKDGGSTQQLINFQDPNQQLGSNSSGGAIFDASQYAFFGNEVLEEVELGGLENDEDDLSAAKFEDAEFLLNLEEGVFSEIEDLSSTFTKVSRTKTTAKRDWIQSFLLNESNLFAFTANLIKTFCQKEPAVVWRGIKFLGI